jgi:hypothetical protein
VFEGGGAFLRWYPRPAEMGLKVPLQCEVLEHDFLDTQKTEILDAGRGNVVIHGVEYNSYGQRVAYWLFPTHPGEVSMIRRASFTSERVSAEYCDHIFDVDRPGQVTGVPWSAVSILRHRDFADKEEADMVRRKIAACFTVFVRRGGTGPTSLAQSADQSTDASNRKLEKISPGMIAYVEGEGDVTPACHPPRPTMATHAERQQYALPPAPACRLRTLTGNLKGRTIRRCARASSISGPCSISCSGTCACRRCAAGLAPRDARRGGPRHADIARSCCEIRHAEAAMGRSEEGSRGGDARTGSSASIPGRKWPPSAASIPMICSTRSKQWKAQARGGRDHRSARPRASRPAPRRQATGRKQCRRCTTENDDED